MRYKPALHDVGEPEHGAVTGIIHFPDGGFEGGIGRGRGQTGLEAGFGSV